MVLVSSNFLTVTALPIETSNMAWFGKLKMKQFKRNIQHGTMVS
jgi:hypothetical protein